METLLTLSVGEYSNVEIVLHLVVAMIGMTAVLLALTATTLPVQLRLPLFLAAVALGGAAWFESGVWQSWQEAFELAGTSYCVTGHLIADEYRIIAWSLGVPVILFSFGLLQPASKKTRRFQIKLGISLLMVALAAPFSTTLAFFPLLYACVVLLRNNSLGLVSRLAITTVFFCFVITEALAQFHFSLGEGLGRELSRGEILRALLDLFSLVVPTLLLLIGVLRLSKVDQQSAL